MIDGNAMSASGNAYTSNSGDSSGMVINIASSDVTSANVYYGESLMSLVDTNLTNILAYNGDINTRINNLNQKLTDFSDQKDLLADRMAKVTERYTLQFAAMEQSIAGLKETGNYLDQMLKQDPE